MNHLQKLWDLYDRAWYLYDHAYMEVYTVFSYFNNLKSKFKNPNYFFEFYRRAFKEAEDGTRIISLAQGWHFSRNKSQSLEREIRSLSRDLAANLGVCEFPISELLKKKL